MSAKLPSDLIRASDGSGISRRRLALGGRHSEALSTFGSGAYASRSLIGYLLASRVSNAGVSLAVGLLSAFFASARLIKAPTEPLVSARPSRVVGMLCGAVSGFTSMIAHAGAPPFQIYVLPQRLERDIFVGTSVVFFAAVNWMKLWPFLALGQITRESILTSLSLFPLALVSTWGGVLLVRRFSAERLASALYVVLLLIGIKLIWDGILGVTVFGGASRHELTW